MLKAQNHLASALDPVHPTGKEGRLPTSKRERRADFRAASDARRRLCPNRPPAQAEPSPPEKPLPGDCCGSGCVRCVWDIYYEELEAYNQMLASRSKGSQS
ncbi:hypothetical protein C4D60_Mb01t21530 [Musa balbisiana]|uniref:Oxidoreductase-like domain-containing protein n=1 Tax=Musa balbisiana TaxID=52838 RepID=A0A4S8JQK1_MUSBA|nr:hypothetical protein C4D60_Mb01t21530 [Musa balbisiana]